MTATTTTDFAHAKEFRNPSFQAVQILHIGFTIAPVLFGLDKFSNLMVDWTQYLAPFAASVIPAGPFMMLAGCRRESNRTQINASGRY